MDIGGLFDWPGYRWTMIGLTILTALGSTLGLIGGLAALVNALGRRQWGWAAALLLAGPLAAVAYGLRYRAEAGYALRLSATGILLLLPFALFLLYAATLR